MNTVVKSLLHRMTQAAIDKKPLCQFEVTPDEYAQLMTSSLAGISGRPQPPIKAKANWYNQGGLFSSGGSGSYVEYDFHAPEYLKAIAEYDPSKDVPRLFGLPLVIKS